MNSVMSHEGMTLGIQWPGVNVYSPVFMLYRATCTCREWRSTWDESPEIVMEQWRTHEREAS